MSNKFFFSFRYLLIFFILFYCFALSVRAQNIIKDEDLRTLDNSCQIPFQLKLEKSGILFLLLEPKYFQTEKLTALFRCLDKQRSKLAYVMIEALSDESQLDKSIKEFTRPISISDIHKPYYPKGWKPVETPPPDFYRAYYYRSKNEYFLYSPNPQKWEMTTVNLKDKKTRKKNF